jgi:hypothetical protein
MSPPSSPQVLIPARRYSDLLAEGEEVYGDGDERTAAE